VAANKQSGLLPYLKDLKFSR